MRKKRQKGYWLKRKENFQELKAAKDRAKVLRINEYTAHVIVQKLEASSEYQVLYSVAKWYFEELQASNIQL